MLFVPLSWIFFNTIITKYINSKFIGSGLTNTNVYVSIATDVNSSSHPLPASVQPARQHTLYIRKKIREKKKKRRRKPTQLNKSQFVAYFVLLKGDYFQRNPIYTSSREYLMWQRKVHFGHTRRIHKNMKQIHCTCK